MPAPGCADILAVRALHSLYLWSVGLACLIWTLVDVYIQSFWHSPQVLDGRFKVHIRRLFRSLQSPVTITGNVPDSTRGPYIFMANHTSLLDVPLLKLVIPVYSRGILSDHQFSWPVYGAVLRRTGEIPIPRKQFRGSLEAYGKATRLIQETQISVTVLPEGCRSLDGRLLPFKTLPFQFAIDAGVPIVPVFLRGPFEMKSKNSWYINPQQLHVHFGSPVPTHATSPRELRERVFKIFQSLAGEENEHVKGVAPSTAD
jgi:1-acyl-sn-glycerol-3-phosphate acyltransferase